MASRQRYADSAAPRNRASKGPVHGPQAARGAHNVMVPLGFDRVHAAMFNDRADFDARTGATLP